ncbi:MAG: methyltransferase [Rhodospirillales bacterium]|nr:methyltransferase [Rhodospirillales bacterium]
MDRVRAQYEAHPYPARDPKDEAKRLVTGSPSHLLEIDHYLFAGARDWSRPFRALVAGGGTGDATIMLAQQLADLGCPAEIVYLDLSEASRRIAEARAAKRKLASIVFRTGSLLDAPDLGSFDYIDCCGVLHHLEDPDAGLRALVAALAPDGGIGIMLYGALGRTGVYPMQSMLRALGADLALARRLLSALPESNWFRRNPFLGDHLQNDAGLYDLLLHAQDRAYTVPEIYALLERADLRLVAWIEPARYEPESYLADPVLRRATAALAPQDRAAFAENLSGSMKSHVFYAVRAANPAPTVATFSLDAVPVLRELDGSALARNFRPGTNLSADLGGHRASLPLPPLAGAILERIDGRRSFAEIEASLPPAKDFAAQAEALYRTMNGLNRMLLRARAGSR